jgi:hypothetical protein
MKVLLSTVDGHAWTLGPERITFIRAANAFSAILLTHQGKTQREENKKKKR